MSTSSGRTTTRASEGRLTGMRRLPALAAGILLLVAACGRVAGPGEERAEGAGGAAQPTETPQGTPIPVEEADLPPEEGLPPDYWDFPLPEDREVPSLEAANLAYLPNVPDGLGPPVRIMVGPQRGEHPARRVFFVYRHPQYGRFVIEEAVDDNSEATEAWIRAMAGQTPGCVRRIRGENEHNPGGEVIECTFGERRLVTLASGATALLFQGDAGIFIHWVEPIRFVDGAPPPALEEEFEGTPGLSVRVHGPGGELTAEEAIAVANLV